MFQDMTKNITKNVGSFRELVEVQTRMLETLTRQQMECSKSCVEATLQQTKGLSGCKTPEELVKLQQAYARELEDTLKKASESNLKTIHDAQKELEKLGQDMFDAFASRR